MIEEATIIEEEETAEEQATEQEAESEQVEQTEQAAEQAAEAEEVVVTIGEEQPQEDESRAPDWVRDLRRENRAKERKIRELEATLKASQPAAQQVLGPKPTLADCDFDGERFETALTAWHDKKREMDAEQERVREAERRANEAWQNKLTAYKEQAKKLRVPDFEEAEEAATATLSTVQQGIIITGAERPDVLIYALGKNPQKARELAGIEDPVKFAFSVAKLESQLKVGPKKTPPNPEKVVSGGSQAVTGAIDSHLERLRAEAAKTGDFSKVVAYRKQLRDKAK